MAQDVEKLVAEIVSKNDYIEELERDVAYYMATLSKKEPITDRYSRTKIESFKDPIDQLKWEVEEVRRCREGYKGMSGKMYFYFNYCYILNVEFGKIEPEFRVADNEWFSFVEEQQASKRYGIVCVKRRRVGASWKEAADVLHDAIFIPFYKVGMNSKSEADSIELFKKVKFLYSNLPSFLRVKSGASTTRMHMDFSYYKKDADGNRVKRGNQSEITVKTPVPTAFEGFMLNKWVCDEAGKQGQLPQMWRYTEECLRQETRRVGIPILFGTSGEVGKEGAGLRDMWKHSDAYRLKRYFFAGWNGLIVDEFGNDRVEDGIRWIIYERYRLRNVDIKLWNDFVQQYPLTVDEAFSIASTGGVGNIVKINEQLSNLREEPADFTRGFFSESTSGKVVWNPSQRGKVIMYENRIKDVKNLYNAGCLPSGEKVITDSGLKNIENVSLNDKLIDKNGNYVEIKELQRYVVDEPLYEVKVKNTLRTTRFTGEHPLYVSDNVKGYVGYNKNKRESLKYSYQKFDFKFIPVSDIKKGQWIKFPNIYRKYKKPPFDTLWVKSSVGVRLDRTIDNVLYNNDFWWFVGLWLGDGYVRNNLISISCDKDKTEIINRLIHVIENIFNRKGYLRERDGCIEVSFSSEQISSFLIDNFGKYANGKVIPEWAKFMSDEYKLSLVGGYIDSDGCVMLDKRRNLYTLEIVSVNLEMMEHMQDILFSLGIISSTSLLRKRKKSYIKNRYIEQKETYRLRMGHYWLKKLHMIGCPSIKVHENIYLQNRSNNMGCFFSDDLEYIYFQITEINKSHIDGIVYNFHCENSTYLCKNITTHNCDPADHDDVTGDASDMSLIIQRKRHGLLPPQIVLDYTDRPEKATDFYRQSLYALIYYNETKALIERNRYNMISNLVEWGYRHLVDRTPDSVRKLMGGRSTTLGIHMNADVKGYLEGLIREYIDEYWKYIPSEEILKECIKYGSINTDRLMAWGICLIQAKEDSMLSRKANLIQDTLDMPGYAMQNGKIVRK